MSDHPPPDVPDIAALRAANTTYGLEVLRKFIELSTELATLLVEEARQTAAGAEAPPASKATPRAGHATDFNLLFRGVRRAVLLTQKLLAEPEPPRAPPKTPPDPPPRKPMPLGARGWQPERDEPDRLDDDPPPYRFPTAEEKILKLCRELNIKELDGATKLIDRDAMELLTLKYKVAAAINRALAPFGLQSAGGIHPNPPDTS
jgi:hypothetical protein